MFHLSGKVVVEPVDVFPELRVDRDDQGGGIALLVKPAQKCQFWPILSLNLVKPEQNLNFGKFSSFWNNFKFWVSSPEETGTPKSSDDEATNYGFDRVRRHQLSVPAH